jgi:hypothetical protein
MIRNYFNIIDIHWGYVLLGALIGYVSGLIARNKKKKSK